MGHVDVYRGGRKLVSVTQLQSIIAKPYLEMWRNKLCQCKTHALAKKTAFKDAETDAWTMLGGGHCGFMYAEIVKTEAAELGTRVHKEVEEWFTTGQVLDSWANWTLPVIQLYEQHHAEPTIIRPEETLIDEESGLAGSPDQVLQWDGRNVIGDIKIKNQLDSLTGLQGAGYRYLLRRLKNVDINEMMVIWAKKEAKGFQVDAVSINLDEWMKPFKSLVDMWNVLNPKRMVKVLD